MKIFMGRLINKRMTSEYLEIKNEGGHDVDQRFVCKDSSGGG